MYFRRFLSKATKLLKQDVNVIKEDVLYLKLQAGRGGDGLRTFNGVGGNGGSIYLCPSKRMSFIELIKSFHPNKHDKNELSVLKAGSGSNSKRTLLIGKKGANTVIEVPVGIECVNEDNSMLLARCRTPGKKYLIASGGQGGCAGENGETFRASLHLKLRPNIGLVGFPNAGKSSLLKAFVPKKEVMIANYPFTTLKPQLCYVKYENNDLIRQTNATDSVPSSDKFSLSVADLPGLIEGAALNRGCGHAFLKHMEYAEILVFVVDVFGFQLAPDYRIPIRTPLQTIALLNCELEQYHYSLLGKPVVIALNKIDLPGGKEKANELMQTLTDTKEWAFQVPDKMRPTRPLKFHSVIPISAKKREIDELKQTLKIIYDELHPVKSLYISEVDAGNKILV